MGQGTRNKKAHRKYQRHQKNSHLYTVSQSLEAVTMMFDSVSPHADAELNTTGTIDKWGITWKVGPHWHMDTRFDKRLAEEKEERKRGVSCSLHEGTVWMCGVPLWNKRQTVWRLMGQGQKADHGAGHYSESVTYHLTEVRSKWLYKQLEEVSRSQNLPLNEEILFPDIHWRSKT